MNLPILALARLRISTVAAALAAPAVLLAFFAMLLVASVALAEFDRGTNGNDRLIGTNGADTLMGLGGNDYINGRGGNDELSGNKGNDREFGQSGADRMDGGSGADLLVGGDGSDDLAGADGNDTIYTGTKTDKGAPKDRDEVRCGGGFDEVFLGSGDSASHNIEKKDVCEVIHHSY
jgi:Ca2+-binding RTX toxin-like protein